MLSAFGQFYERGGGGGGVLSAFGRFYERGGGGGGCCPCAYETQGFWTKEGVVNP